jgi:capsular polysaccharide export protein
MVRSLGVGKHFLFLQGPHGPFFDALASMLRSAGARCWRVGFNRGDEIFWSHAKSYLPFIGAQSEWPDRIREIIAAQTITDIVLYGDTRFVHAEAVRAAQEAGLRIHVFEEGYLRPYWVTYEREGSNGNSKLMTKTVEEMRKELAELDLDLPDAPARWGDMRQHIFYGALYHGFVLLRNRRYGNFRPHRALSVEKEFRLYLRRLLTLPLRAARRRAATRRIKRSGVPYHLVLLQLEHDSSFIDHSPFASMDEFLRLCIKGFAEGAPPHHHLIFKGHPLEDGRTPISALTAEIAAAHGVADRVQYVPGGKLASLLNDARTAVTVNSTAGQQALWRGLPLRAFGSAVYAKPEFVSDQPLEEFFANPRRPDSRAYRDFRHYLLETSQLTGGFYSRKGRQRLLRQVTDLVLAAQDPYDALAEGAAAPRQHLRLVN